MEGRWRGDGGELGGGQKTQASLLEYCNQKNVHCAREREVNEKHKPQTTS